LLIKIPEDRVSSKLKAKQYLQNDYEYGMARLSGLEKKDAPWHLRWF